jgi:hypothetical protein
MQQTSIIFHTGFEKHAIVYVPLTPSNHMPSQPQTDHIEILRAYLAATCIGHSTLRNQGASDVIQTARDYLSGLDLNRLSAVHSQGKYTVTIDEITLELVSAFKKLPQLTKKSPRWGAARKSINLFMRETCYNHTVHRAYNLARLEKWMEIPLDSLVGNALRRQPGGHILPKWPGLIGLGTATNAAYQTFARNHVATPGETLPALDMRLWLIATASVRAKSESNQ